MPRAIKLALPSLVLPRDFERFGNHRLCLLRAQAAELCHGLPEDADLPQQTWNGYLSRCASLINGYLSRCASFIPLILRPSHLHGAVTVRIKQSKRLEQVCF